MQSEPLISKLENYYMKSCPMSDRELSVVRDIVSGTLDHRMDYGITHGRERIRIVIGYKSERHHKSKTMQFQLVRAAGLVLEKLREEGLRPQLDSPRTTGESGIVINVRYC